MEGTEASQLGSLLYGLIGRFPVAEVRWARPGPGRQQAAPQVRPPQVRPRDQCWEAFTQPTGRCACAAGDPES